MNGFIEVTCTRKNGSAYKRLIAVEEIVSVIEENNYASKPNGTNTKPNRFWFLRIPINPLCSIKCSVAFFRIFSTKPLGKS